MPERPASILLAPAGQIYGLVMSVRNTLYDLGIIKAWRAPAPVVSVGNITTGGTGKTPLVDWIVKFYRAHGRRVAIVSRGYGRRTKGAMLVSDGSKMLLGSRDAGDEVAMLAARNPSAIIVVAEKRQQGVELLMREFAGRMPEVIVLDDAFQHRKIARDLDIVVINAQEPFGGGRVLPAGRLREPIRGLGRAGIFILSKVVDERQAAGIVGELKSLGKPVVLSRIRAGELVSVGGKGDIGDGGRTRALAFAGIGAPQGFVQSLRNADVEVVESRFFRDHQPFTVDSVKAIVTDSKRLGLVPVTTEKDWFRIIDDPELAAMLVAAGCRYLPITPDIYEGREVLEKMLIDLVSDQR
ncbi:MAG: tetraacyldisaccharide 4'-kinase [Chlorobiaceae bacterium]|nr:tetraacyldisaccharide 4'-kinase [Chlorobiaceae bacterium]